MITFYQEKELLFLLQYQTHFFFLIFPYHFLNAPSLSLSKCISNTFVRFGLHQFKDFANRQDQINTILWGHREQDAPDKIRKDSNGKCTSTTGVILEM